MKRLFGGLFILILGAACASGCLQSSSVRQDFKPSQAISVVSREDGSGTRSTFTEQFCIGLKSRDGSKKDRTTKEAVIVKQTYVMMTQIAADTYTVGYISLGSLNGMVKALQIDGAAATAENIKNGTYPAARPFILVTRVEPISPVKDFIGFILSREGQALVSQTYIAVSGQAPTYRGKGISGKIVVAGSSSVTPIMEKLKEAYSRINPDVIIEIQQSDSSSGIRGTLEGTCDMGMSSRDLKKDELSRLTPIPIALDGIAVIVNRTNPISNLTQAQVKNIFTGITADWREIHE